MSSGYDDFIAVLKNFRSLSVTAIGAGAAVPFAAYLSKLAPPWPPGIMFVTALAELVTLIVVFQLTRRFERRAVTIIIVTLGAFLFVTGTIYLILFSIFTYQTLRNGIILEKGYACRPDVQEIYGSECPFLNDDIIQRAGWDADRLWSQISITIVHVGISIVWLLGFVFLSGLIGAFIVYQSDISSTSLKTTIKIRKKKKEELPS